MSTAKTVIKNTTILLVGRFLSIGLGIVYVAALARYIHAAGMGKIAIATSLVSILNLIINFGLSQLIVRDVAGDKTKAGVYFSNTLVLRGLLSIVFGIIIVGITRIIEYPYDITLIIYIYGFAYVLDTLTDVAFSIFNAFEKMEYPAAIQTGRDIANVVLSLLAIYLHANLIMIVFISAVACLLKLLASLVILRWRFVRPRLQIDPQLCRRLLVAAIPFATLGIISIIDRQIDVVLLSFYHSEEEVGWFSAANTLITYLLLVPGVFMQAIFPVFAKFHTYSRETLQQAYGTSFKYLLLLGFPLCVGTIVTADRIITLVYGPGFENAASALRILSFTLFWIFGYANGTLLNATGGQSFLATVEGLGLILNIIIALVLIPKFSLIGASIAAIVSGVVFFSPITIVCHRRLEMRLPFPLILKCLVSSICMGIAVSLSLRASINLLFSIFVIAPIVYGVLLLASRAIIFDDIIMLA